MIEDSYTTADAIAGAFRPGDVAPGDVVTVRYHDRRIRGRVYDASDALVHFTWVGDDADRSPWATVDPRRDGSADYESVVEIVLEASP